MSNTDSAWKGQTQSDLASATPPHPQREFPTVLLAIPPAAYLLHVLLFNFVCDDAYISFRYAKNLAHGLGLRFNPLESPPVEGFSNFLWVVLCAGFDLAGIHPAVGSRIVSVASGLILLGLLYRFVRKRLEMSPLLSSLVVGFFALFPPVAVWSTSGLAIMPFTLLVFVVFERLLGDPERPRVLSAGVAALALTLLRLEGIAWALLILFVTVLSLWLRDRRHTIRRLWPYPIIVLCGYAAFTGFRLWYFGDWISNTAHTKSALNCFTLLRGSAYAGSFVLYFLSVGVILLASLSPAGRPRGGYAFCAALMVAATFASSILVGGDFMPFFRLFVIGTPFLTILFACLLKRADRALFRGPSLAIGLWVVCVALSLLPAFDVYAIPESIRQACRFRWTFFRDQDRVLPPSERSAWQRSRGSCRKWERLGKALKVATQPGESLVQAGVGAVGYYSDLHIYDMAGLADRSVAQRDPSPGRHSAGHDKVVPTAYFEDKNPTYLYAYLMVKRPDMASVLQEQDSFYLGSPENRHLQEKREVVIRELPDDDVFSKDEILVLGVYEPARTDP